MRCFDQYLKKICFDLEVWFEIIYVNLRYFVICSEDLESNWIERREYKVQIKVL